MSLFWCYWTLIWLLDKVLIKVSNPQLYKYISKWNKGRVAQLCCLGKCFQMSESYQLPIPLTDYMFVCNMLLSQIYYLPEEKKEIRLMFKIFKNSLSNIIFFLFKTLKRTVQTAKILTFTSHFKTNLSWFNGDIIA